MNPQDILTHIFTNQETLDEATKELDACDKRIQALLRQRKEINAALDEERERLTELSVCLRTAYPGAKAKGE